MENDRMTNILTRARPRLLASVAAGLMAATAITAAVTALPSTPVRAESAASARPSIPPRASAISSTASCRP
jgi:hypothetical protein